MAEVPSPMRSKGPRRLLPPGAFPSRHKPFRDLVLRLERGSIFDGAIPKCAPMTLDR
jgi:hypothetical protein